MNEYPIRTAEQLNSVIAGFRKSERLTQKGLANRLGIAQQTYSASERNAANMSAKNLLALLNALGVEMVLRPKSTNVDGARLDQNQAQW